VIDVGKLRKGIIPVVVADRGRFDGHTGEATVFDGIDVIVEMDATGMVFRFRPDELHEREDSR
jgi:hypothetical protein